MGETLYECSNPACSLGDVGAPGRFTGGATAEFVSILTGKPQDELVEGEDYGEGICPNCGKAGEGTGETHESNVGTDEHDDLHQEVAAKVASGEIAAEDAQDHIIAATTEAAPAEEEEE